MSINLTLVFNQTGPAPMIDSLLLKNFQSHKNTNIKLSKGVNCIIGSSDVGKTSIIRALRWLVMNRPQGEAFRSNWGGDTEIVATIDNQHIIRSRSGKKNVYFINDIELEALRTDVPDEIKQALNVNEINLQRQFDRPFLIDETPGNVAQFFNTIAHINVIDQSLGNLQSWVRDINRKIGDNETRLIESEKVLAEQYANVDDLDEKTSYLEKADKVLKMKQEQSNKLTRLHNDIDTVESDLEDLQRVVKHDKAVSQLIKKINDRDELIKIKAALQAHIFSISTLNFSIATSNKKIELEQPFLAVQKLIADRNRKHAIKSNLSNLLNNIVTMQFTIKLDEKEIEKLHKQFDKEFPSTCPLCGRSK
jgi:DNA repair protein SbcC/Rad50